MRKKIEYLIILLFPLHICFAQDKTLFQKQWFIQNGDTMPYRILLPKNFDSNKSYPLILFLHGRGESGNDNEKQLTHGSKLFLSDTVRDHFPAIVIYPQCAANNYWSNVQMITENASNAKRTFYYIEDGPPSEAMTLLLSLIENIFRRYKIDPKKVYAGGLSMGGMGTFELVRRMPNTFAAAFAICGGAHPATAKAIRKTSWWIFHGLKDDVVDADFSKQMADAIKKAGGDVKLTLYPNANHNSWDSAFAEKELLPWLHSHNGQRR